MKNLMRKTLLLILAVFIWDAVWSQSYYTMKIDSYGSYNVFGKKFCILSGDSNIEETDLQFVELSDYLAQAMIMRGAIKVSKVNQADLILMLKYEISDASYMGSRTVATWGKTGQTVNTTSTTTGNAFGSASAYGNSVYGNAYGSSTTNTNTVVTPTYGVTGYREVPTMVEKYFRSALVYGFLQDNTEVLKLCVTSSGSSNDLRKVFPYMMYSVMSRIGKSTGGIEEVTHSSEQSFLRYFIDKKYLDPNVYYLCRLSYDIESKKHPSVGILYVKRTDKEIVLCLYNSENVAWHVPSENSYIMTSKGAFPVSKIGGTSHYPGGNLSAKTHVNQTITLHFKGDFRGVDKFNFVEYLNKKQTKKGYEFIGVTLE